MPQPVRQIRLIVGEIQRLLPHPNNNLCIRIWALTKFYTQSSLRASFIRWFEGYWKMMNLRNTWKLKTLCSPYLCSSTLSSVHDLNLHVTLINIWSNVILNFKIFMLLNRNWEMQFLRAKSQKQIPHQSQKLLLLIWQAWNPQVKIPILHQLS